MNPVRPDHRLRKHADYQAVYTGGRRQNSRNLGYFFAVRAPGTQAAARTGASGPRVGLTVPKAMLARAHDRNRVKRRMRELVRAALPLLTAPVDLVLHPRRGVLAADFAVLAKELATVFRSVQHSAERVLRESEKAAPPAPAPTQAQADNVR